MCFLRIFNKIKIVKMASFLFAQINLRNVCKCHIFVFLKGDQYHMNNIDYYTMTADKSPSLRCCFSDIQ